jgi:pyruvate kinase
MLSGETAAGSYPIECVKTMAKIAEAAEEVIASHPDYVVAPKVDPTVDAIVNAVGSLEREMKPKAIVCASSSGQTPRLISKYRPRAPILCASWQKQTLAYMAVVWGVETVYIEGVSDMENNLDRSVEAFMKLKKLRIGDRYIYTAGFPAGTPGSTNLILTQTLK